MANLRLSPSYLAQLEEEKSLQPLYQGLGKKLEERQKRKGLAQALETLAPGQGEELATLAQANPKILQDLVVQQRKEQAAKDWRAQRAQRMEASLPEGTRQQPNVYQQALQNLDDLVATRQLDPMRATQMEQDILLQQQKAQQQQEQFGKKQEFAEQKERYRRVEPIINQAQKKDDQARTTLRTTEELRALDDAQNFSPKAMIAFNNLVRDQFDLDFSSYLTPETQAYDAVAISLFPALTQNLPPGVRAEKLLTPFKQKLPNLMRSQEGREILYESFDLPAKEDRAYNETIEEILTENKGEVPNNFKTQLRKRFEKKQQDLYKDYRKKLKSVLDKTEDAFSTGDIASDNGELLVFTKKGWETVTKKGDMRKRIGETTFIRNKKTGEWEEQ